MTDSRDRLVKCFEMVFPDLSQEEILSATPSTVAQWDSLAMLTLQSVIEEEFGIVVTAENLIHFTAFEKIVAYIELSSG